MSISLPFRYLGLPSSIDIYNTLDSIDRISALPDSIRGVILSFLPTKNAVATSTLSKTWKFLWRTVHTLDFCLDLGCYNRLKFEQIEDENKKFVGFVNRVLLHHDAGVLNMFRLEWRTNFIQSQAASWVNAAITRNVHELSLNFRSYDSEPFDIKLISIFSCDSLRSLHLNGWICLPAATVFCLPRLENLDLDGVTFESDETFEKMIRGCPVLNHLHVCMSCDTNDFRFVISSTSLRRLELNLGNYKYMKLEASSLEHLKISGYKSSYDSCFHIKPISVFSRDSLRSLHLDGRICFSAATVFCLPRLENLYLDGVTFESDETFEKMIRECPVLNYLHISMRLDTYGFRGDSDDTDDFGFVISSTSLRHLELYLGRCQSLKLEASSLEHLTISDCKSVNFAPKKLTSLVEANFGIDLDDDDFSQAGICNSVVDAVSALDCVKILTLSDEVMRALSCATIKLSTNFKRLVKLKTRAYCCHWSSLLDLIQSSNNLEVLAINQAEMYVKDENDHDHSNWTTPVEVPRCLSNSLKKVAINWYSGYEDEREMIRYMLKHGSVLEDMQILCHRDKRREIELLQEICEFPRKSPACEVEFFGWKLSVASVKRCNDNYTVEVCF